MGIGHRKTKVNTLKEILILPKRIISEMQSKKEKFSFRVHSVGGTFDHINHRVS